MQKKDFIFCVLLLVMGCLVAGFIGYNNDRADKRVTAVQRDLDATNELCARLQSELDTLTTTIAELDALDERIKPELADLGRRFGDLLSTARDLNSAARPVRDSYNELGRLLQSTTAIAYQYEAIIEQYANIRISNVGAPPERE